MTQHSYTSTKALHARSTARLKRCAFEALDNWTRSTFPGLHSIIEVAEAGAVVRASNGSVHTSLTGVPDANDLKRFTGVTCLANELLNTAPGRDLIF